MADLTGRIALAQDHVNTGRRIVARQRQLIAKIRALGGNAGMAEDLLAAFERSLVIFEADLAHELYRAEL
jgi:uncharacterized protein YmfQ (DUF2313 family)